MARVKKYLKGFALTFDATVNEIICGNYVFLRDKPVHPGWIGSWQMWAIYHACKRGDIFRADINPKWLKKEVE